MFFSVSKAFDKKREELFQTVNSSRSLSSNEVVEQSEQLDHFVNHYLSEKESKIGLSESLTGSKLILKITGQLDIFTSDKMKAYIGMNKQKWDHSMELSINLLELEFFDTSGLESLFSLISEAKNNNLDVKINGVSPIAYELFSIMGIFVFLDQINCEIIKNVDQYH